MSKPTADDVLDILRASYNNDSGSADELIDSVFNKLGVKRVVGPPPTNMTPFNLRRESPPEIQHKPIHVSSGDKEWAIISYYEAPDGHMCIDIEEV